MIEIVIPNWPRGLSPNRARRMTMHARSGHEYMDREQAKGLMERGAGEGLVRVCEVGVEITFYPPYKHKWDAVNAHFACKAILDGVVDGLNATGWEGDDSLFWPVVLRKGEPVKGGKVVIRIGDG